MGWLTGEVFDVHSKLRTYSDHYMRQVPRSIKDSVTYERLYEVLADSCYNQTESMEGFFYDLA